MDLSIIIPVFNAESTIEQCIMTIEDQVSQYEIQIIAVDDGSVDNSVKVLQKLQKCYSNIEIFSQKNLKQSAARNNGLAYAKGKYVAFFDSDDDVMPGMISSMLSRMEQGNDLVVCGINKIYFSKSISEVDSVFAENYESRKKLISRYLTCNNEADVGLWNKIFRRDILDKFEISFSNGDFFEDSLFVLKYLSVINYKRVLFIPIAFYNLYKREGSTTTSFKPYIDIFADKYISQVASWLSFKQIKIDENVWNAFVLRIHLHVIHHHIKYDGSWNSKRQKDIFVNFTTMKFLKSIVHLTCKYSLALIVAQYFPGIYYKLYKK